MKFYNGEIELYELDVEDSSYRVREVMGSHELSLTIKHYEPLVLPVGCHVDYEGVRYFLFRPENIKKNGGRSYEYTVIMHPYEYELSKYKLRNPVDKRLKFSYNGTPAEHLQMIVDNLNMRGTGWTLGAVTEAPPKLINYNHTFLSDALRLIATEFETEYEVNAKELNLGKVEHNKAEPLELSYRQGFKAGISRKNTDNTKPVEILFVQGGERNIDPSVYGGRELLLPAGQNITYQGRTYQVDAQGLSLQRTDKPLSTYEEDSLDLSHIYPKREGTVSTWVVVNAGKNLYDITDSTIPESLDYSDYLIAGEKMSIIFQSGMLAGREFDVNYKHDTRKFEIVPQEYDGVTMPGGAFLPAQGDKYVVFGCTLPASYIRDDSTQSGASWDMLREAVKFKYENEDPRYSFLGEMDGVWSKSRWLDVGGKIRPGGYVLYSDADLVPDGVLIRIVSVKDFVNSPHKPKIELSNITISSGVMDQIKKPEQDEVIIDDKHRQGLDFTRRRFRDARETISMLQAAFDDFDPAIDPIAVQTLSLLVGAESLQFRFVNSKTSPSVVTPNITYNNTTKVISAPAGIIQHMSLGISSISPTHQPSEYRFWDLPSYTSPALTDPNKSYYLYAWVTKSGDTGSFLLRETAQPFDAGTYYYLLIGTLGKEVNGIRSYTSVYGFTEILPGRITTDLIKSPTGQTYFNLSAGDGAGEIGGVIKFLAGSTGLSNMQEWGDLSSLVSGLEQDVIDATNTANAASNAVADVINDMNDINDIVDDLDDYIDNAFRDGLIEEAEAKAIETYINQIQSEKAGVEATYNKLYVNPILEGTAKTNLLNSKISYFGAVDNLTTSITNVISDGKVTPSEKQSVNSSFATYKSALATFSTRIEEAKQFIEQAIKSVADDATNTANDATNAANIAQATAAALDYIKEAILDGSTTVAGGLILANLLMLRGADNVVRAGLSGIKDDNVFLFADPSNAYAKAIAGTAMFVLRKDGTSKLGIMKIDTDNVGLYKDGTEMMQFRTGNVPTRSDLISSVDISVIVPGGTDTRSGNYAGNFGNSNAVVTTAPLSSFSLNIYGSIYLQINNNYNTPIIESQVVCNFVLERLQAGVWVYDRIVDSEYLFSELPGETSQSHTVNSTINLAVGSYRLRIEYNIDTLSVNDTCFITASATMHALGAQANKAIIFGDNGLIRIKDGNNYSLFSDEAVEHKMAADKYLLLDSNGVKVRGGFDVPGLRGSGSITSIGTLSHHWGAISIASRTGQGVYLITHNLGHTNYSVNITPYNSSAQISAVVSSKTTTNCTIRIVNPANNSLTDSSFDFAIYADA